MSAKLLSSANGVEMPDSNKGYSGKPIAEIITNGFITVDRKWTVKYWNKAAEKILGVEAKDIMGKNLWEKFAGSIPVNFYTVYHKAFLQDVPVHFEEYWGEMGTWFDVIIYHCGDTLSVSFKDSNQAALVDQQGPPEQAEQKLKILTELYRLVTEVTNDCLWEWDLKSSEIFWIDGGHKRVFGYQVENALIPQNFWENCLHPDDKVRILASVKKIITDASAAIWEDEYRFKKANGDYAYVHDRGHLVYDSDKGAIRMIGATQDITARVLLEKKIAEERLQRQREITDAVLTGQENERADIGKDLHDNLNQILAVTKMYIQMAQSSEINREENLNKSHTYIVNVIDEIRRISKALVIPPKHIIGLFDNIRNLLNDLSRIQSIKIEFHKNGIDEEELNEKLQVNIFRMVQEQVSNILKHSKATHASITISRYNNEITLLILDNGEGCDILKERKGVGIRNIISRAELYQGTVTIVSKPGEGYELKVVLPLTDPI